MTDQIKRAEYIIDNDSEESIRKFANRTGYKLTEAEIQKYNHIRK